MKKLRNYYLRLKHPQKMERKWIFPLAIGSIVSLFLLFLTTLTSPDGMPLFPLRRYYSSPSAAASIFIESKLNPLPISSLPPPPRFAYLISGSAGDGAMLRRTLEALYHPNNQYVVHLDAESSAEERLDLYNFVTTHFVFLRFKNVRMITKANLVTYRGPTMVANTLHAAAILLKEGGEWDWFINLSASDYPLVTQDGKHLCFFKGCFILKMLFFSVEILEVNSYSGVIKFNDLWVIDDDQICCIRFHTCPGILTSLIIQVI